MSAVKAVAKPQLRNLLQNQIKKNLIIAAGLCTAAAVYQKFCYNDVRKEKYAEFFKHYDINKEFNKMRNKGLFDSCKAD